MVRTQIQLTEEQAAILKKIASARHKSMAELIRQAVEMLFKSGNVVDTEARIEKAIAAAGRFHSGLHDISLKHDKYLAETLNK